jgi:hypothetical protein
MRVLSRAVPLCACLLILCALPPAASAGERLRVAWSNPLDHGPMITVTTESPQPWMYTCLPAFVAPGCAAAPTGTHWDDSDRHSIAFIDDNPAANHCFRFRAAQMLTDEPPYEITTTVTDIDGTQRSQRLTLPTYTANNRSEADLGATPASSLAPGGVCAIAPPPPPPPADLRVELDRRGSGTPRRGQVVHFTARVYDDGPGPIDRFWIGPSFLHGWEDIRMNAGPHPCAGSCDIRTALGTAPLTVAISAVYKGMFTPGFGVRVSSKAVDSNADNNFAFVRLDTRTCRTMLTLRARTLLGAALARRVTSADVFVAGKRVRRLHGRALLRPFTLRGLSGSRVKVTIAARTRQGTTVTRSKRLSLCTSG